LLIFFLDLSEPFSPQHYSDHHYRGGGNGNVASTTEAQNEENPVIDLNLSP